MTLQVEANTHLTAGQKASIIDSLRRRLPSPDSGRNWVAVLIRFQPVAETTARWNREPRQPRPRRTRRPACRLFAHDRSAAWRL